MFVKACVFIAHAAAVIAAVSDEPDPCLAGNHRNITHLNERYLHLKNGCPFTDHRIEKAWFFAGVDPILTFPPNLCACGYNYPIWMNGSLPSISDGIVDRIACVKVMLPCHLTLTIQVKNCGEFFVYHLTPGPEDTGYCFGIDKIQTTTVRYSHIPTATVEVLQGTVTSSSFITTVNVTSDADFNSTWIILLQGGSIIQTIPIGRLQTDNKWENLLPETNYTILVYTYVAGEKHVLSSVWTLTKPYYQASGSIKVQQTSISEESITFLVTFNQGSENLTAEGTLKYQNSSVVRFFHVDKPVSIHRFQNLNYGTRYHIELYVRRDGNHVVLDSAWTFTQPRIKAYLETMQTGDIMTEKTFFNCEFEQLPEQSYTVRWTVKRAEGNFTIDKSGASENRLLLALAENDLLKNHIHLPFSISCAVAQNLTTTSQTDLSVSSRSLFAGIKVLTPQMIIHRGETGNIKVAPTVPFGCLTKDVRQLNSTCNLSMTITVAVKKACTGISTRSCHINILGIVNYEHNLQIQATEDGQYGVLTETTHDVILKTEPLENSIWSNYILPAVKVTVRPENETYWRGKRCEALNDPHMYTFDSLPYEHHEKMSDEYVLYAHTSYNAKIHHKIERCNTNAMCNCGVAAQAGRDIYLISTCNGIVEIGYKQCDDGVLLVKQETDTKYTIYLPYGTSVTARLDKTPYSNSTGSMIVSVSIFPSVHDQQGRSRGLCGTLDNNPSNDFHGRTGELILNRTDFIQAWRVSKDNSLFKPNVKSTAAWLQPACTCNVKSDDVTADVKCRLGADSSCSKGKTVGKETCKMTAETNIGKTGENVIPTLDLNTKSNHSNSLTTRSPQPTVADWNHSKAKFFCTTYMETSRAYRLCTRVPFTDTKRSVETCIQDIILTQTTEWHRISRRSMQDSCVSEIYRNKTVRDDLERPTQHSSTTSENYRETTLSTPEGPMNSNATVTPTSFISDSNLNMLQLTATIEDIACPNECSDRGICSKGVCMCEAGYGSYDCSIDFSKPPVTASLLFGTLCDERNAACTHVYIHGGFFASESVRCHVTTFETLSITKGRQNMDAYVLPGQAQSLIEVICPLRPRRYARSIPDVQDVRLISCYQVSVSNDGIHHGLPLEMCVYNSKCQQILDRSDGTLTAYIKVGFCFIDGECVPSGMIKSGDNTYCNPQISPYHWSVLSSSTVVAVTETKNDTIIAQTEENHSWMVPVLAVSSCTCIICIAIVIVVCLWKRKLRYGGSNDKEKDDVIVSYTHDPDFDEGAYAYINPKDIKDDLSYVKTSTPDDYARLDINGSENANYSKLKGITDMKSEQNPALPERYKGHEQFDRVPIQYGPYQTLNVDRRYEKDYDKLAALDEDYLVPSANSNTNT